MALDRTAQRRWIGVAVLAAALLMLVLGLTVLSERLRNLGFLAYWMSCLALTGLAVLIAFMDARALRERTRREEKALLEDTLKDIVTDARAKTRRPASTNRRPQRL